MSPTILILAGLLLLWLVATGRFGKMVNAIRSK